jgi:hypothetical protein
MLDRDVWAAVHRGNLVALSGRAPRGRRERGCLRLLEACELGMLDADPPLNLFQAEIAAGLRDIEGNSRQGAVRLDLPVPRERASGGLT